MLGLISTEDDLQGFMDTLKYVKENGHPPISDLLGYTLPNSEDVDVDKFVTEFRKQMKHNYTNLSKLEFTSARHHLLLHSKYTTVLSTD